MIEAIIATAIVLTAAYGLFVFYLAVMNLKRVRDMGKLQGLALALGYPILITGLVLDLFVNVTLCTVLFLELPQEMTVTSRLKRHNRESTGWRQKLAAWFEPMLDPFDPSGDHI